MKPEEAIQRILLTTVFHKLLTGRDQEIPDHKLEPDGRSRAKVIRELGKGGYVIPAKKGKGEDATYFATPKVWDDIPPEDFDLLALWQSMRKPNSRTITESPYVRLEPLFGQSGDITTPFKPSQLRLLLNHADEYDFWVLDGSLVYYHMTPTTEKIVGPLKLDEVAKIYDKMLKNSRGYWPSVHVSSERLREQVADIIFEEMVEENFPKHVGWGFASLGILDEEEAKLVSSHGISSLMLHGLRLGDDTTTPDEWEGNFEKSVDLLIEQLGKIQERLAVARKIQKGIAEIGGWDKFRGDYRKNLVEAFQTDESKGEKDEGDKK